MFPSFIGILDIQSWWEVPSIAYFCSLFRTAFNLLDFDIEELEEALLTDGTEECASTLLTELIVRLLNGCLGNNDISAFNYQMFLRRLFRQKCQETGRYNPFNTDIDFQFLPLRTKVEILYALCDFRLDAEDVFELFKNLEAESLRVDPLGYDQYSSAYWYFYGTRLYREDYKRKPKSKKRKNKDDKRKKKLYGDDWLEDPDIERVWQVVCFTEDDWNNLTEKFKDATSTVEKELYQSLSENFLPEIPRLFQEKERLQRKRLLEFAPRRTSNRVLQKIKQKEEEDKSSSGDAKEPDAIEEEKQKKERIILGREHRAKKREQLRSKSESADTSEDSSSSEKVMSQKEANKPMKLKQKQPKNSPARPKGEPPPSQEVPVKSGRKTNNSLANATGQIVIPETIPSASSSTRKILKTSQIFGQSEEDIQTDMYKVLEQLTAHEDAWPFMDPVEEEYAPNYYAVIRRPMDLKKMEERLDSGYYKDFAAFKSDFKLIVNNCRLYNGQQNEYTAMVDNLQEAFDRLTERYIDRVSSSDEEIAVEYPLPTPARKHKIKDEESPPNSKKRRKTSSNSDDFNSSREYEKDKFKSSSKEKDKTLLTEKENVSSKEDDMMALNEKHKASLSSTEEDKNDDKKEERKSKDGKVKKKHKEHHHHHHSKHSKSHKKSHHKSSKKSKKEKHRKRKRRHSLKESEIVIKHSSSCESLESSNRSRSASPLPSIHTPTPSPSPTPTPSPVDQLSDPDFYKDKYDKIKERRRQVNKNNTDVIVEKHKSVRKPKHNLSLPEKDKNQKLRETIEKLKAKNEKYKETLIFNNLFSSTSQTSADKSSMSSETLTEDCPKDDQFDFVDESDQGSQKSPKLSKDKVLNTKKGTKKVKAKNESATEALEQAVKDISKWLDDGPKKSSQSTPGNSPAQTNSTEEQDSRLDDDFAIEKGQTQKKDIKKKPTSRETKVPSKRRDVHRTIERLHPGKSKGNLIPSSTSTKVEEIIPLGPHNKSREIKSVLTTKVDELSPKLSLGSVLPAVGFTLGKDHKFSEEEVKVIEKCKVSKVEKSPKKVIEPDKTEIKSVPEPDKIEEKISDEPKETDNNSKFSQEKATPNLSAWFKAFGAPKSTPPVTKKKKEDNEQDENQEEKPADSKQSTSPKSVHKYDSPPDEISPSTEGGDSPIPNITNNLRQRRTSTGSSVSERSSFSQDLDSPRHQMAHTSPLLRSPASPRTDDFQKISYPIINGPVRAGFYQDTASIKSSPEKSCSPRDGPQSPYSPYSQHVYANNNSGTTNPTCHNDINKSPLPTYGLNQPPPYYDSSKAPIVSKPSRTHDDYIALGPDTLYQQKPKVSQLAGTSPVQSPYSQHSPHSPYSPQTVSQQSPTTHMSEAKAALYPVKKRSYSEDADVTVTKQAKIQDATNDFIDNSCPQNKDDYQKLTSNAFPSDSISTTVDDIVNALSKKSEMTKVNSTKENTVISCMDKVHVERIDVTPSFDGIVLNQDDTSKQGLHMPVDKQVDIMKSGSVDMINMGYLLSDFDKRSNMSDADMLNATRELQKANISKGYDIGSIAMNLGMNRAPSNHYSQPTKNISKNSDLSTNQNILDFDNIQAANQSVSNFGLTEYDAANKNLYSGTTMQNSPIDYCNWKNDNQVRKTETVNLNYHSNCPMNTVESNKIKSNLSIPLAHMSDYNKPVNSVQVQGLQGARAPMLRGVIQNNLRSELRIPNPRGTINIGEIMGRNMDSHGQKLSVQRTEKPKQNTPASSLQYKPPYSSQSSNPLDTLRNIQVSYLSNEERYLTGFGPNSTSLYHDKNNQMSQMFNKSLPSEAHSSISSSSIYSQATASMSKDSMTYKSSNSSGSSAPPDKSKQKRKKTETRHTPTTGNQTYQTQGGTSDVLSSVKNSLVPGSAFNFGPSTGMTLGSGLYGDSSGFSLEDFRNSTANQFMAANYMVAAAAAHQRNTSEANTDKLKPAHQNTAHTGTGAFPFLGHGQARASYPFGTDASSPLYQQYLQRQEELLGAQIMGLYPPPGYHSPGLGARQPYDAINRPPWL